MVRYIKANTLSTFNADKEFIIDTLSDVTRRSSDVPFDEFSTNRWQDIIHDVRRLLIGGIETPHQRSLSIKDYLIEEGYDDPEEELYNTLIDVLDDVEYNGDDSVYSKFADSCSLLLRGELFRW